MVLEPGNKLLIAHRRLFAQEEQRFFAGEVLVYDAGIAKLQGYSFVIDTIRGLGLRKCDPRIKLVSLQAGTFLAYQLPDETDLRMLRFEPGDGTLSLTDGANFSMNMTETPHAGQI